ncbi:MAG: hypothetical protein Q8Q50_04815 [Methylobacter sp.]|nr:hypothetical protein [Methylobacter sp.]
MKFAFSERDYTPEPSFSYEGSGVSVSFGQSVSVVRFGAPGFSFNSLLYKPVGRFIVPSGYQFLPLPDIADDGRVAVAPTPVAFSFSGIAYTPGVAFAPVPVSVEASPRVPIARQPAPFVFPFSLYDTDVAARQALGVQGLSFVFTAADYAPGTGYDFDTTPVVPGVDPVGYFTASTSATASFVGAVNNPQALSGHFTASTAATASFVGHTANQGHLTASTGATASFVGKNITNQGRFTASTQAVCSFAGKYDSNVKRYTLSSTTSIQQEAEPATLQTVLPMQQTIPTPLTTASVQQQASPLNQETLSVVEQTLLTSTVTDVVVEQAIPLSDSISSTSDPLTLIYPSYDVVVEQAIPVSADTLVAFNVLYFLHSETTHPVQDCKDSLHTVLRRYYKEDEPVADWLPLSNFVYVPLPDVDDGRVAFNTPVPVFAFAGTYTPATSFTLTAADAVAVGRNPVTYQAPVYQWQGVVTLHDFAIYHAGMLLGETESRFQRALRLGVEFRAHVQDARQPPNGISPFIPGGGGTVYPPNPDPTDPPGHVTITVPTQTAYIMQHTISVTLTDLTPISMESVNLSLDADSFAWQFSGTLLDKADLVKVQQVNMEPVQLVITINGYIWKVLVERIEHSRQFGGRSIALSGRGLTALLGQPYEQPASATQSSTLTVQQLAELQLPTGWTINWTAPTWSVPSGAYSYNNQTPIQALAALASDIGAMIVPSRDAKVLNIMPRYPVLPWDFPLLSADVVIPEAVVTELSQRPVIPYQANGVYVHGGEVGGVLSWCRLDGTDGARLAATVSNALMTDVIGTRMLGERLLAADYTQPMIRSMSLPMDGTTVPLLVIGQLVSVTLDGVAIKGIINSVQIEATLGSVRQSVQIGEETPNTWAMFKELLPRDPLLVGVLSVTDGVTSLVTLLDGGVVRVRGTGDVGGKYYIRAGKIDGEAPNLVLNEVVL